MNLHLAPHYGMCFGVRDALRATHDAARREPVTLLGQLVHNPVVDAHLRTLGVRQGSLTAVGAASTARVVITAHGASEARRRAWQQAGYAITDTTCPLVHKAHQALAMLVREGYHPVVIGQAEHVEVQGLVGDFPQASVVLEPEDVLHLPAAARLGIISQTTQPLERVLALVSEIKRQHPGSEVRLIDTVCHPTKQRQTALEQLCQTCPVIVVIGGRNSNNTRQLTEKATRLGARAYQVETAAELQPEWFQGIRDVGITAGTSTLDETVTAVMDRIRQLTQD
ncbi:MAG: 4-hydroxy-3-methylbut-2-enyl diphosphate reductase [Prosthecobacter sp.]|jgi:4-hydroxy-3-methylbut-2-enyl diphosphate reductase|nr:4-hydroxy-3-methylbut-2-enyl diphosphate reductase [Prosthecobacter sp.]